MIIIIYFKNKQWRNLAHFVTWGHLFITQSGTAINAVTDSNCPLIIAVTCGVQTFCNVRKIEPWRALGHLLTS